MNQIAGIPVPKKTAPYYRRDSERIDGVSGNLPAFIRPFVIRSRTGRCWKKVGGDDSDVRTQDSIVRYDPVDFSKDGRGTAK